jgi:hypothetical protein
VEPEYHIRRVLDLVCLFREENHLLQPDVSLYGLQRG